METAPRTTPPVQKKQCRRFLGVTFSAQYFLGQFPVPNKLTKPSNDDFAVWSLQKRGVNDSSHSQVSGLFKNGRVSNMGSDEATFWYFHGFPSKKSPFGSPVSGHQHILAYKMPWRDTVRPALDTGNGPVPGFRSVGSKALTDFWLAFWGIILQSFKN